VIVGFSRRKERKLLVCASRLILQRRNCFRGTRHQTLNLSIRMLLAFSGYSLGPGKSSDFGPKVLYFISSPVENTTYLLPIPLPPHAYSNLFTYLFFVGVSFSVALPPAFPVSRIPVTFCTPRHLWWLSGGTEGRRHPQDAACEEERAGDPVWGTGKGGHLRRRVFK
jgi:hypothetical protein